jgi:hypothetical protein
MGGTFFFSLTSFCFAARWVNHIFSVIYLCSKWLPGVEIIRVKKKCMTSNFRMEIWLYFDHFLLLQIPGIQVSNTTHK